ncbi:MAG: prohibitin family protein [Bacteroidota bacterium]|nr:prohibitin family protein [Bacteroidota bacterium]
MNQKLNPIAIVGLFAAIFILLFGTRVTYTVGPGQKAVVFYRFGKGLDKENVKNQGFHFIAPWNEKYIYNVRIQEDLSIMEVLSKNGLTIKTELSYRYKPVDNKVGYVHDDLGINYHDNIIIPEIRSVTREVIGEYLPEELYSTKREVIEDEIFERTKVTLLDKNLLLDAVLIRDVTLPKTLQDAIENKLKQEQISLEYDFKLVQAEKEAQKQIIEAEGKAKANRILSASLTDNILRDKGIEATLQLSESPNSKVVVVGSAEDGLPIILGK